MFITSRGRTLLIDKKFRWVISPCRRKLIFFKFTLVHAITQVLVRGSYPNLVYMFFTSRGRTLLICKQFWSVISPWWPKLIFVTSHNGDNASTGVYCDHRHSCWVIIIPAETWPWSTMVKHGQARSTMVKPWSTMLSHCNWPWSSCNHGWPWSMTMVNHAFLMHNHGQQISMVHDHGPVLTMVNHGDWPWSTNKHGPWPWSSSDHGQPWSTNDHGQWPWSPFLPKWWSENINTNLLTI